MDNFALTLAYINGFAVLILILTLSNYWHKLKYICCEEKIFIFLVFFNIAILIIEAALKALWYTEGRLVHVLLHILQILDFGFAILLPLLWLYYLIYRIYQNIKLKLKYKILIPAPGAAFILFMVITLNRGFIYTITDANSYLRGPLFILSFLAAYIYIAASIVFVTVKRKELKKGELFPYLMLPLIPMAIGFLEFMVRVPVSLTWSAVSLVTIGIQMHILNKKTNIDHLTGLNNRMVLDSYLNRLISESKASGSPFGIIMIDMDDFKLVNDKYGHAEGDMVLKATANILCECFSGNDFLARYGGDEFTVVIKDCSRHMMDESLIKLEKLRKAQNKNSNKPYEIKFSIGAYVFAQDEITDAHTMLMRVDKIMYENKNARKAGQTA